MMKVVFKLAVCACLLLLVSCGAESGAGGGTAPGKIAIAGARLEPGGGKPAIDYSIVIVEGGKFKAVGPQTSVPLPKDAEIVNGLEHTLVPLDGGSELIEPGQPANLVMKGPKGRTMREGKWQ